jgi:hypothetical protein
MKYIKLIFVFCLIVNHGQSQTINFSWAHNFGGSGSEISRDIAVDPNGNSCIIGRFSSSTLTIGSSTFINQGNVDIFITKLDPNGNVLWSKTVGGTGFEDGYSIVSDNTGNVYCAGIYTSPSITFGNITLTNSGGYDIFFVKYNSSGNLIWANHYGGVSDVYVKDLATDNNGNIYMTGFYSISSLTFGSITLSNAGSDDLFLTKFDPLGNVLWAKRSGTSNTERSFSLATDLNNNVVITGGFYGSSITFASTTLSGSGGNVFIAKYDPLGNVLWAKGAGGNGTDLGSGISTDAAGNIYATGGFSSLSTNYTISFDNIPVSSTGSGDGNVYVVKYDALGNALWAKGIGGCGQNNAAIISDGIGNVYLTGFFTCGTINFGNTVLTSAGGGDIFNVKLDPSGNIIWANRIGGNDIDFGTGIVTNNSGEIFITGYFHSSTINFGGVSLNNFGSDDFYISKLHIIIPSVISFFNKFKNTPLISENINNISTPFKVCADGSSATFIEYQNNDPGVSNNDIQFRILEDTNNSQHDIFGYFDAPINVNATIRKVLYNHPTYMDASMLYRQAWIQVIDQVHNNILAVYPIEIYRAPVLFVHGWRGNKETFKVMEDDFYNQNIYPDPINHPLTLRMTWASHHGFKYNRSKVKKNGIDLLLLKVINAGFSAGKVDIVAHSMGGLLSRLYIQEAFNSVPYNNDVHKLITLNTPHSGSPFADWVLSSCDLNSSLLKSTWILFGKIGRCADILLVEPALDDLRVNGSGIDEILNGPTLANNNRVPTYAITSKDDISFSDPDCAFYYQDLGNYLGIFNNEPNDDIVTVESQQGNIFPSQNPFPNTCHVGSSREPSIVNRIREKINEMPNGQNFDIDGYIPSNLSYPLNHPALNLTSNTFINILEDTNTYNANNTINISITGSQDIIRTQFVIGNEIYDPYVFDTSSNNYLINFHIPNYYYGEIRGIALGFDSSNNCVFDTIKYKISTNSFIDDLIIEPETLYSYQYQTGDYTIKGHFSDGITRVIPSSDSLIISIGDSNVITPINSQSVYGNSPGTTYINFNYGNISKSIQVIILSDSNYLRSGFISGKSKLCKGENIHFQDISTGNPDSIKWNFVSGNPVLSILSEPTVEYDSAGKFPVQLIAYFSNHTDTLKIEEYVSVSTCPLIFDCKLLIQGFYLGNGEMKLPIESFDSTFSYDTITVTLNSQNSPYSVLYSERAIIKSNGNLECVFPEVVGGEYYISISHRNSLCIWSSMPIALLNDSAFYDFASDQNNTYGGNCINLGNGKFGMYSGDTNQNGDIDLTDYNDIFEAAITFSYGYINTDITGDNIVESLDVSIIENNYMLHLQVLHP